MIKLLTLGEHYISDFISPDDHSERNKYSLDLFLDSTIGAARLKDIAPKDKMWGKYWYRSGTNLSMTLELKSIAEEIVKRVDLKENDIWLDIACNDGTMFKFMPSDVIKIGIDPCDDTYLDASSKLSNCVVQDFFSKDSYRKTGFGDKKCKVITTIAMFYDLEDPHSFLKDIYEILDDNGIWVIQLSYTPLMIKQLAFDNICHEHVYYYSLSSLKKLFEMHDLKIVDANLNDANGGSIRVYIQKNNAKIESFANAPLRDVCNFRIESLLDVEKNKYDISNPDLWLEFSKNIDELKNSTVDFIKNEIKAGKKIYGYGASTKGNTLLQYFDLNHNDIVAIAERSPYKFGLQTVGTNIPIISEEEMRNANPDYLLILPWCFIGEFIKREQNLINNGSKFIVPCPKFYIEEK